MSSKKPEPLSADEAVDRMSAQALICRDLSHNWTPWYASRIKGGFERGLRCGVCGTVRTETLDRFGRLVGSRRYEYPDNYLVPGAGRADADFRAKVRLTQLERIIGDKT